MGFVCGRQRSELAFSLLVWYSERIRLHFVPIMFIFVFKNKQMGIKYEIQSIKNSQGSGKEREFARIYENPPMTAGQLESRIQASCSLTKADVKAALSALREYMIRELSCGNRFYIPSIGYFSLSVSLGMSDDKPAGKVRGGDIKVRNIKFRPDASMLQEIKDKVNFERATFTTKSKELTEEAVLTKITEYLSANKCINRRELETLLGLRQNTALKWLKHFTEKGVLKKVGKWNSPVYLLSE